MFHRGKLLSSFPSMSFIAVCDSYLSPFHPWTFFATCSVSCYAWFLLNCKKNTLIPAKYRHFPPKKAYCLRCSSDSGPFIPAGFAVSADHFLDSTGNASFLSSVLHLQSLKSLPVWDSKWTDPPTHRTAGVKVYKSSSFSY